jgi:hypothetical protein
MAISYNYIIALPIEPRTKVQVCTFNIEIMSLLSIIVL